MSQHGYARVKPWELKEFVPAPDGSVSMRFRLPDFPEGASFPPCNVEYVVTVNECLTLELIVENKSPDAVFAFEDCLHTYFEIGDINSVAVTGLKGATYLDKVANFAQKTETEDKIRIASEVDRIYLNTTSVVEILDSNLKRRVKVEKHGSTSTVLWNPWITKSQQMPDFGNEEYQHMLCVESGNVASNIVRLPPGETSHLSVKLTSSPL
jgi:D-hexose-6-phosphate mutarotase